MLIFLDIDGVLRLPGSPEFSLDRKCLRAFETAVRSLPEAEIVISSSWRETFSLEWIRSHFATDIAARIIGSTPTSRARADYARHREVLAYLRDHDAEGRDWIAIDDQPDHFPADAPTLVINPGRGFDHDAAELLRRHFQRERTR